MRNPSFKSPLLALLTALVPACVASPDQVMEDEGGDPDIGAVALAIMVVPPSVQCLQVRVHAAPNGVPAAMPMTTQSFATTAGAAWSASVGLGLFAEGMVQIQASTFNVACGSLTGATASFVADPTLSEIIPGVRAAVTLNFRENFAVSATGNFAPSITELETGNYAMGMLLADGTVRMVGNVNTPSGLTGAVELAVGNNFACVRRTDATVWCWGDNGYGQLGNGTFTSSFSVPVQVTGLSNVTAIGAGGTVACASTTTATSCWGWNANGAVGDGTTTNRNAPVTLSGVGASSRLAPGSAHSCIIRASDGQARCWGVNGAGELGNGLTTNSNTPVAVTGLNAAVRITVGASHTCATDADHKLYCWGDNAYGSLGLGDTMARSTPTRVTSLGTIVTDVTATNSATCALTTDHRAYCWGTNSRGSVGDGSGVNQLSPVQILSNVEQVSAGCQSFACALQTDNAVSCWGENNYGQLGDGSRVTSFVPVAAVL